MTMPCPDPSTLRLFADSLLDDTETERIEKHLGECEACRTEVERLERQPGEPLQLRLRKVARLGESGDEPREEEMPERIGQYKIIGRLGGGGMGTVYRAVHPHLNREVAVKVINFSRLGDPAAQKRFVQEMQSLGKLTHPNIVHATDAGIDGDLPFIVTELLDGQDLGDWIKQHDKMPVKQAVDCIRQAATGLAYAHKAGYVHRDIKPSNLFLLRDGNVKVLDLGIAKPMTVEGDQTMTGHVIGSPEFMAPEQLRGGTVDVRSDIYSLGRTFTCLLTGRVQATGSEPIPAKLKPILDRMTAELPNRRYQTMSEIIADLDAMSSVRYRTVAVIAFLLVATMLVGYSVFAFVKPSGQLMVADSTTSPLPTIAVFEFDANTSDALLDAWRQGMRDMLATDIAQGKRLQVVERSRLHDVLTEHRLTDSPFIDQKTAVELGRGLAAHWIIVGSFLAFGENMRIDARIVSVEKGTVVVAESINGKKDEMLELEKRLAEKILKAVDSLYPPSQSRSEPPRSSAERNSTAL